MGLDLWKVNGLCVFSMLRTLLPLRERYFVQARVVDPKQPQSSQKINQDSHGLCTAVENA